ncbi:MAG: glycosyltransferase family 1 protein [Gammaproteobacteria bacterium]|nr:glycosyltransferase family 1 protein [Gammaproteobacteria bacterium]
MSAKNKILIITDAWHPQVNGVVILLSALIESLGKLGISTQVIHPGLFATIPLPKYPEIALTIAPWRLRNHLDEDSEQRIHIATEGPLGLAARSYCSRKNIPFTTAIHTKFPEYVKILFGAPVAWGYRYLRWFHRPAEATIVQSEHQANELIERGLSDLRVVGGGVDTEKFYPQTRKTEDKPILLYVGRVSKEKNIEAFLDLAMDSKKVVVGDGPDRERLQRSYVNVDFKGYRTGEDLVREYAQADCLVFTSKTDTFGLVLIEAMACGTPVASYPTTGPLDVVRDGLSGVLNTDLSQAVSQALLLDRTKVRSEALNFSWENVARRFAEVNNLQVTDNYR